MAGAFRRLPLSFEPTGATLERQATTDQFGNFRLDGLPPGGYQVIVNAHGFAEARAEVEVVVSSVQEITVTLRLGSLRRKVWTSRAKPPPSPPRPSTSLERCTRVLSRPRTFADIPLAHRSFANIAYLVPGTEPVEPSDPTKARITAVSFGGSSGLNVQLSVDGADNSDDYIGGFLQNFSPDTIQEFAVRTAQEDADTGRTTAGSVVIVTKRGTDAVARRRSFLRARRRTERALPD